MTAKARLTLVVAVLLMALGVGCLRSGTARAEENCLPAPNGPTPKGSHWYYRTDPIKQSKCWYLRTEGQATQKPAAEEGPKTGVATKWPGAPTSKIAPDQSTPEPMELRPAQEAPAASAGRPTKGGTQHGAQPNRQAAADKLARPNPTSATTGAGKVTWPDPPAPPGAGKVAWPDPPAPPSVGKVAWPDPPAPPSAGKVAWPDPPAPPSAGKVAWPDPPSPAGADKVASHDPPLPAGEVTSGTAVPEEGAKPTQEVPSTPANSVKDAAHDAGLDRRVIAPIEMTLAHSEMPVGILLAVAIGLVIAGLFLRWIVRMTFARQRAVRTDRQEPVWTTSTPSAPIMPKFIAQDCDLSPGSVDEERLDDEVKEALRKLSRLLDRPAVETHRL